MQEFWMIIHLVTLIEKKMTKSYKESFRLLMACLFTLILVILAFLIYQNS